MIDSVFITGKNYYSQVFSEECKFFKEKNMTEYITDEIEISSDYFDEENSNEENSDEENSNEEFSMYFAVSNEKCYYIQLIHNSYNLHNSYSLHNSYNLPN